jgi:hypothetical protein
MKELIGQRFQTTMALLCERLIIRLRHSLGMVKRRAGILPHLQLALWNIGLRCMGLRVRSRECENERTAILWTSLEFRPW